VLLHGFLGSGKNLTSLARGWAARDPERCLLLPDLPGHGTSPRPPEDATLASAAQDVLETARAQGVEGPLEWVGHSLGGRVALAAAKVAPEAISRVTLLDITPSPIDTESSESGAVLEILERAPAQAQDRRAMRTWLVEAGLSPAIADWLAMNLEDAGGQVRWRIDRALLGRLHQRVNAEDLWDAVERLGPRLRCVKGGRSPYLDDAAAERLQRQGCQVVVLPQAGHFLHVDAPAALVHLLSHDDWDDLT
jgi:esterase